MKKTRLTHVLDQGGDLIGREEIVADSRTLKFYKWLLLQNGKYEYPNYCVHFIRFRSQEDCFFILSDIVPASDPLDASMLMVTVKAYTPFPPFEE